MKRFYGYRQVKETIVTYDRYRNDNRRHQRLKEQIISISVANNFVNQFTSLFVKLPQTPPAVTLATSTGGAGSNI